MKALRALVVLAMAPGLLAACGGPEDEEGGRSPYESLDVTADTSVGYGTGAPAPVTAVQGGETVAGALTATGQFRPTDPQNPTPGAVTVTEVDGGSRVLVQVNRYLPNSELLAVVVAGRCDAPGAEVQRLDPAIRIGEGGLANLDSRVPIPTTTLLNGEHALQLRGAGGEAGSGVVACADLPSARGGTTR